MDDLVVIGLGVRPPQRQIELTSTRHGSMASSRIATVLGQERKNIELKRRLLDFLSEYSHKQKHPNHDPKQASTRKIPTDTFKVPWVHQVP
jgi:hypothetical protein